VIPVRFVPMTGQVEVPTPDRSPWTTTSGHKVRVAGGL
jgi:hypothetical protein